MNMMQPTPSPASFLDFWRLGYQRLVPIVPPDADVSDRSSLAKRINTSKDPRGKAVGVKGSDGRWFGFDWVPYEADERDTERWQTMGAGIGIKTGEGLVAIDADTLNEDHARVIRDVLQARLGLLPVRIGNYPKALYLCRVSGELRYTRIEFGERNERGQLMDRVEILSDGRQFVAHGIHPKTRQPYRWPQGVPAVDDLPLIEPGAILELLSALRPLLPAASEIIKEGATTLVAQESLRGDADMVRRAIEALPNTSAQFGSRESYRDIGYAIKAAMPDDEPAAFEIFADWCAKWEDGENDPGIVEADWRRMKPPFRRGASWLYELAETHNPQSFNRIDLWFEPIQPDDNPFANQNLPKAFEPATDVYEVLSIADLMSRPAPKFLVARHIPEVSVGFLYSAPGVGKSFLALDMALHLAFGRDAWHGDALSQAEGERGATVLYIASEGSFGFRNRIQAWMKRHDVTVPPAGFRMIERTIDFMEAEDIERLMRTVRQVIGLRPVLIVVDTVSRAMPGADENLQKEMTLFVRACDRLKEAFRCAVLGIHHAGKSGDMRGSTVLRGAGDFVFKLERKQGATVGRLECEKQKDAPDGWSEGYRFDLVSLDDGETSLVPTRCDASVGPSVLVTPDVSAAVLRAMEEAWAGGEPWGRNYRAGERMASRRMVQDFGFTMERAEEVMGLWEQTGTIAEEVCDKKTKRKGWRVCRSDYTGEGVFD